MNSQAVGLTADEFKARLCENLKSHGFIDLLKSQIRTKLISELNRDGGRKLFSGNSKKESSLARKAVDSLVAHHLVSSDYDYSLSIFIPESGLDQKNLLSVKDILHVLDISPDVAEECQKEGPLNEIIKRLLTKKHHSMHVETQTDKHHLSVEAKLARVESFYQRLEGPRSMEHAVDGDRMDGWKEAMEERMRIEMELKMSQFKRKELSHVRKEERNKMRQDMEKYKQEVDRVHQDRLQSIIKREENLNVSSKEKEIASEKDSFRHRQMMLEDINRLKEREDSIKRKEDDVTKDKKMMEDKFSSFEEMMRKREGEVEQARKDIEERVWSEVQRYKVEVERDYQERIMKVNAREDALSGKEKQNETFSSALDNLRRQVDEKNELLSQTEKEVKSLKSNLDEREATCAKLLAESNELRKTSEESDILKKELSETRGHLARVLREGTLEKQELSEKLSRLTSESEIELRNLKDQNKQLRDNLNLVQEMNDKMSHSYQAQLNQEINKSKDLQMKLSSLVARQQTLYNDFVTRKSSNRHRMTHKKKPKHEIDDDDDDGDSLVSSSSSSSSPGNDIIKDARKRLERLNEESKKLDSSVQRVLLSGSKFMPSLAQGDTASQEYFATNHINHNQLIKFESKVPPPRFTSNQIKGHADPSSFSLHREMNKLFFNNYNDKQISVATNFEILKIDPKLSMTSLRERVTREVERGRSHSVPRSTPIMNQESSAILGRMISNDNKSNVGGVKFGSRPLLSEYAKYDRTVTLIPNTLNKYRHKSLDVEDKMIGLESDHPTIERSIPFSISNNSSMPESSVPNAGIAFKKDEVDQVVMKYDASELPTSIKSKYIDLPKLDQFDYQSNAEPPQKTTASDNDALTPIINEDGSTFEDVKDKPTKEAIDIGAESDARQVISEVVPKSEGSVKEDEVSMDGKVDEKDGRKESEMNKYMDLMRSSLDNNKKSQHDDSITESDSSSGDYSSLFESSTSKSDAGEGLVVPEKVEAPKADDDDYADGW